MTLPPKVGPGVPLGRKFRLGVCGFPRLYERAPTKSVPVADREQVKNPLGRGTRGGRR